MQRGKFKYGVSASDTFNTKNEGFCALRLPRCTLTKVFQVRPCFARFSSRSKYILLLCRYLKIDPSQDSQVVKIKFLIRRGRIQSPRHGVDNTSKEMSRRSNSKVNSSICPVAFSGIKGTPGDMAGLLEFPPPSHHHCAQCQFERERESSISARVLLPTPSNN